VAIITISRGTLTGGRVTAQCLADQLDYPCVGREILVEAAEKIGVSEQAIQQGFERPPKLLERSLSRERRIYRLAVQTALAERCLDGKLVYHGLAGQFLLDRVEGVIRIRLIAPMSMRVRALMAEHRYSTVRAAEKFVRRADHARRRWVKHMYGEDVEEPSRYELTLNLEAVSLDAACAIIAELAQQPQYQVTEERKQALRAFVDERRRELSALLGTND
jgi:cytidylate kinase